MVEGISLGGVTEIVNLFIAEARLRLSRVAVSGGQPARLLREVHALKGDTSTVCACCLADLAAEPEARSRAGGSPRPDDANVLAAAFDTCVAEVQGMIQLEPASA